MTTEQTQQQGAQAAQEPPQRPSIAEMLADDSKAGETVTIADLKPFLEQHTGTILEQATTRFRTEQAAAERAAREAEEANASAKSDIDFATGIEERLRSTDPAVAAQAQLDMESGRDRYRRGLALAFQRDSSQAQERAIAEHMNPLLASIHADGKFQPVLDLLASGQAEIAQAGGNWLLASLRRAELLGYERGKTEAANEADEQRRIADGAQNPPAFGGGNGASAGGDLLQGIERRPGAASQVFSRIAQQRR